MRIFLALLLFCTSSVFAQDMKMVSNSLDTINGIVFGSYPELFRSNYKGIDRELLAKCPNRSHVDFEGITASQRDSIIAAEWLKFRKNFNEFVDFETISIDKKTKEFFFTLYFNDRGDVTHVFYNWNKYPNPNKRFNETFKAFAADYDFGNFPAGKSYSQCGTFVYKKGKPKN